MNKPLEYCKSKTNDKLIVAFENECGRVKTKIATDDEDKYDKIDIWFQDWWLSSRKVCLGQIFPTDTKYVDCNNGRLVNNIWFEVPIDEKERRKAKKILYCFKNARWIGKDRKIHRSVRPYSYCWLVDVAWGNEYAMEHEDAWYEGTSDMLVDINILEAYREGYAKCFDFSDVGLK